MERYLLDKDFLRELDLVRNKETYAKVISLNNKGEPLEEISGRVTSGSVNIDGTSAVRRTCSLSLVAKDIKINDFYWGLKTKFKLEIGVKNSINKKYPDIIWFPLGFYIITSFSTSQSINSYTISINGEDKMALLNGDYGGVITSLSEDFGVLKTINYKIDSDTKGYVYNSLGEKVVDTIVTEKRLLKDIIKDVVFTYANEPDSNIVIEDLDDMGVELLEYRGDVPMYMIIQHDDSDYQVDVMTIDDDYVMYLEDGRAIYVNGTLVDPLDREEYPNFVFNYDTRINLETNGAMDGSQNTICYYKDDDGNIINTKYSIAKIEYGETCGYRLTDLTYTDNLTVSVGTSVTSGVLDPIKNMLGEFEYFYDLDGRFIFRRKKTYINESNAWNTIMNDGEEEYVSTAMDSSAFSYEFEDGLLISSYQNSPDLKNLRNDFSIWGTRESSSGKEVAVHLRYAIDDKPVYYKSFEGKIYTTKEQYITYDEWKKTVWEYYKNKIEQQHFYAVEDYVKTTNPNGLPEDWWEVNDWAEYYKTITGDYPTGTIGSYANGGNGGKDCPAMKELAKYFNAPIIGSQVYSVGVWLNTDSLIYIFDVDAGTGEDGSDALGYLGHGTGCGHVYSYFTDRRDQGKGTSYIYKPLIPEQELEDKTNDQIEEAIRRDYGYSTETEYDLIQVPNVDWREIIYQMARDYSLYNKFTERTAHKLEDPSASEEELAKYDNETIIPNETFLLTIANNNPDYYPNGITGYEQYYTDIYSFWREIYNPDAESTYLVSTPTEDLSTYYIKDDENLIALDFDDAIDIVDVDLSKEYYLKVNNTYYELETYDASKKYYKKSLYKDLTVRPSIEMYYYYYDDENKQYIYLTDDDKVYHSDITDSSGNQIALEAFKPGSKYYTYKGFQPANILKSGIDYYIDNKNVIEKIDHTNPEAQERKKYDLAIDGSNIYYSYNTNENEYNEVLYLNPGETYYYGEDYKEQITIDSTLVYYSFESFSLKYDFSDCNSTDIFTYLDTDEVEHKTDSIIMGCKTYRYEIIDPKNIKTTKCYRLIDNESTTFPTEAYVIKSYEKGKEYIPKNQIVFYLDELIYYEDDYLSKIEPDNVYSSYKTNFINDYQQDKFFTPYLYDINANTDKVDIYHLYNSIYALAEQIDNEEEELQDLINGSDEYKTLSAKIDKDKELLAARKISIQNYNSTIKEGMAITRFINENKISVYKYDETNKSYTKTLIQDYKDLYEARHAVASFTTDSSEIQYYTFKKRVITNTTRGFFSTYYTKNTDGTYTNADISTMTDEEFIAAVEAGLLYESDYFCNGDFYFKYTAQDETDSNESAKQKRSYWSRNLKYPEKLNFWFDFLDTDGQLDQFKAHAIGSRPKAVNDNDVKAIYFRETPSVIFVNQTKWKQERDTKTGYVYVRLPQYMENMFSISSQGKSANDQLEDYLYDYACCAESITITSLPIYYLEPNTRITVRDDNTNINGEYIVSRISLPLSYNGTMSISATKAIDRIY